MHKFFTCLRLLTIVIILVSCGSERRNPTIIYDDTLIKRASPAAKYGANTVIEDGSYGLEPHQKYDLYAPQGLEGDAASTLVIIAHPGAFVMGDKSDYLINRMCKDLARAGITTAAINYRLVNFSLDNVTPTQRKATFMGAVEDARLAIAHIQSEHRFSAKQTYFVGYSAGGIIANHLVFTNGSEVNKYCETDTEVRNPTFDRPVSELLNGVVSISGAILDATHLDDVDLANDIRLLMIHGQSDGIVPINETNPFQRLVDTDLDFKLPMLYYELGGSYDGKDFNAKIGNGIFISSEILKVLRFALFSDRICGSRCIMDDMGQINQNIQLVEVVNGPHSFMHNNAGGALNRTYGDVLNYITDFTKPTTNVSSGRRGRRRRR